MKHANNFPSVIGVADSRHLIGSVRETLTLDREMGLAFAATMLAYLKCEGDVRRVSPSLHARENSHRYQMRKLVEQLTIDLGDPELRSVLWMQLRCLAYREDSGSDVSLEGPVTAR